MKLLEIEKYVTKRFENELKPCYVYHTLKHTLDVVTSSEIIAKLEGIQEYEIGIIKTAAYFHDIGKLDKPQYFSENITAGHDPHAQLAPSMSALIIISHVKQGVDLALKNGLRQPVIDVIMQHHGTSLVYYFYKRALQQQEDARAGGKILKLREDYRKQEGSNFTPKKFHDEVLCNGAPPIRLLRELLLKDP